MLCVVFALVLVSAARASGTPAGLLLVVGSAVLAAVGLAEMSCYVISTSGHPGSVRLAADLIPGVQHGYSMVAAPAIFLSLGAVILGSRVVPPQLGILALAFGAVFVVAGLIGVLASIQPFVDVLAAFQGSWWLSAGVVVLRRGLQSPVPRPGSASS